MDTNTNTKLDYSLTSFDFVIVEKQKLIETLKENRAEHNQIYEAACSGYWLRAGEIIKEKESEFLKAIEKSKEKFGAYCKQNSNAVENKNLKEITSYYCGFEFNANWPLEYPENHLNDYDRVIEMLEFSVADKVKLAAADFNSYVRNDWKWREQFTVSNYSYVTGALGVMSSATSLPLRSFAMSGSAGLIKTRSL